MSHKKTWTDQELAEISRIQQGTGVSRKTAIRKMRAAAKARAKEQTKVAKEQAKAKQTKAEAPTQPLPKSVVSQNRSEGLRLFKLAGRPTREQFILVYGENGPKMTWEQRAAEGVPAEKFQAALATKQAGR